MIPKSGYRFRTRSCPNKNRTKKRPPEGPAGASPSLRGDEEAWSGRPTGGGIGLSRMICGRSVVSSLDGGPGCAGRGNDRGRFERLLHKADPEPAAIDATFVGAAHQNRGGITPYRLGKGV